MNEEEKRILEKTRVHSLNHIRNILPSIKALEEELKELQREYKDYKVQYEEADRALAENDGRLRKITIEKRGGKSPKLSLEQIERIAKELGVEL